MINKSGFDRLSAYLDSELTYVAVGTGAAPSYSATALTAETFRNTVSDTFTEDRTLVKELFIDESQANVTITEVGIFGNGGAELFASFNTNLVKTDTQSLTVSFEIEALEVQPFDRRAFDASEGISWNDIERM